MMDPAKQAKGIDMTTTMHSPARTMDASTAFAPFAEERDALLRMTPAERIADTGHRRADAIAYVIDGERHAGLAREVLALQS